MTTKPPVNLEVDKRHYLRIEEDNDGDIRITLIKTERDNKSFEHLSSLFIPKLQRENLIKYLLL